MAQPGTDPWALTAGEDLRYPEVKGPKALGTTLLNWYVTQVHRLAMFDPQVYGAFLRVMNMLEPPTSLFRPRVLFRVLTGSLVASRAVKTCSYTCQRHGGKLS